MSKKSIVLLFVLLSLVVVFPAGRPAVARQDAPETKIRLIQMVLPQADVWLDGEIIWPNLHYVITSDLAAIEPGTHTLAISAVGSTEPVASVEIEAVEGHQYTVATMGEYETPTPNLVVIDETTVLANYQDTGSNAIIIQNGVGAPPVDVFFVDSIVMTELGFGEYGLAAAPLGLFTAGATAVGQPDTILFESEYFAVPGTTAIAYLTGAFPDIHRNFFTSTQDNMPDYLMASAALPESRVSVLVDLLTTTGLLEMLDQGEFTLFAPSNAAFAALSGGIMNLDDPTTLVETMSYHVVPEYLSPNELVGEHTVTSLNGATLDVAYTPGESFTVNGTANLVLQFRVGNGIIYLIDGVLVPPSE